MSEEEERSVLSRINELSAHLKYRRRDTTLEQPSKLLQRVKEARVKGNRLQIPLLVKTDQVGQRELLEMGFAAEEGG